MTTTPMPTPTHTILHLSDTHILPTDEDRLHGVDTMANLRLALDSVAEHGATPDAILISGDLANGGELESYGRLRGVLDAAKARKSAGVAVPDCGGQTVVVKNGRVLASGRWPLLMRVMVDRRSLKERR